MAELVNNTHSKSDEEAKKATLETLPEEVSLEIINVIKNSSDSSGREYMTRPSGTRSVVISSPRSSSKNVHVKLTNSSFLLLSFLSGRLRDSTLSCASMVSTKFYALCFPNLIENLTISWVHLHSIYEVLQRGNNGRLVKSLYVHQWHVEDESGSHSSTEGETEVELEVVYLAFQAILEK